MYGVALRRRAKLRRVQKIRILNAGDFEKFLGESVRSFDRLDAKILDQARVRQIFADVRRRDDQRARPLARRVHAVQAHLHHQLLQALGNGVRVHAKALLGVVGA